MEDDNNGVFSVDNGSANSANAGKYCAGESNGKVLLTSSYPKNPTMKHPRLEDIQLATGEELRTTMIRTILNDASGLKLKGFSIFDMNGCKRNNHSCLMHIVGTWDVRLVTQGKFKSVI